MLDELATGANPAPDTPAPAQITERDMDKLADKVSEAARAKTETERQEAADKALKTEQEKAFDRAQKRGSKADQDRAPDGKFKSEADNTRDAQKALGAEAEKQPAAKPASTEAAKADVKTDQSPKDGVKTAAEQQDKPVSQPAVKQPSSWSPEKKAVWDAMSPEAQAHVAQREQEVHKAISQHGQFVKQYGAVAETLEAYKQVFEGKGVSFQDGIRQLLDAQRLLDRDPAVGLQHLAKAYGVDLYDLAEQGADPASSLRTEVAQLRQQLENRQHHDRIAQQRAQAQQVDHLERAISDWSKDKVHFRDLEADMMPLIGHVRAAEPGLSPVQVLDKAYERAQWANPTVRTQLLEQQSRDAEAKRVEAAKAAQDQARRASAINVETSPVPTGEGDLLAAQRAAFDRAQARQR